MLRPGPHREGEEPKPMMHERGKSDSAVRAVKPANKAERSAAELVEQRAGTKGNAAAKHAPGSGTGKCVTGAGTHTASCEAKEEGKVHHALPPHQCRAAQAVVLRNQEGRRTRGGRPDVAGLRGRSR